MKACYAGSFDPLTFGHLDILGRALKVFSHVTLAVGRNSGKSALFTMPERLDLIRQETSVFGDQVSVQAFDGLVVEFCRQAGITTLIRGIRTVGDFESELTMAYTNRRLNDKIDTVVFFPSEAHSYTSSRLIKEVAQGGGAVDQFVPRSVALALSKRFGASGGAKS
jgi:pantetheine-phosphate adenylyltransferase